MIYGGVAPSLERVWNNPLGVYIGRISYSVYLVHWLVIVFYEYWRSKREWVWSSRPFF
jgi:peptidoglycan/LPS O-acetylase OafA/YrhL